MRCGVTISFFGVTHFNLEAAAKMVEAAALVFLTQSLFMAPPLLFLIFGG